MGLIGIGEKIASVLSHCLVSEPRKTYLSTTDSAETVTVCADVIFM